MGFGWLFIGYFFANVMAVYSVLSFAMLAGYPLMVMGLYKLAPYHARFRSLFFVSLISLPFALYYGIYGFSQLGFAALDGIFKGVFFETVQWCYFVFAMAFHALLLYAIAGLSAELGLLSIQSAAWRNLILTMLYYLIDLVARLPFVASVQQYFIMPLLLLRIIAVFLNLYLIFRCYRHICSEEENNKPAEPTPVKPKKGGRK